MSSAISIKRLKDVKSQLGAIEWLDLSRFDLIEAHHRLGIDVRFQAQDILQRKIQSLSEEQLASTLRITRQIKAHLDQKLQSDLLPSLVSTALSQYLKCIDAWSNGARLDQISGVDLPGLMPDDQPITSLDLALLLQDDEPGCQTGLYRKMDGSVILWHTEEDGMPDRFDKLRIVTFQQSWEGKNETFHAFVYPDLMPGPAFCWSDGHYLQATDTLHVYRIPQEATLLANIATWITMILANRVDPYEVIRSLGPYWDGYALSTVAQTQGKIQAGVVEFAGTMSQYQFLSYRPGNFLYHGNAFCNPNSPIAQKYENVNWSFRRKMEKRYVRTQKAIDNLLSSDPDLDFFFSLLSSNASGSWDYANLDVKAYFLTHIGTTGLEIWIGPGPAIAGEIPRKLTTLDQHRNAIP